MTVFHRSRIHVRDPLPHLHDLAVVFHQMVPHIGIVLHLCTHSVPELELPTQVFFRGQDQITKLGGPNVQRDGPVLLGKVILLFEVAKHLIVHCLDPEPLQSILPYPVPNI